MSLQENKKQMFEILKNNEEFLNKEENEELKESLNFYQTKDNECSYCKII